MSLTLQDVIEKERLVSLDYHASAGREWLEKGSSDQLHSPLLYAAFEFRMALERFLLELWVCLQDQIPGADHVEGRSAKGMVYLMQDYGVSIGNETKADRKERLKRALQFNHLISEHLLKDSPLDRPLYVPDLDYVIKLWERLSDYCHARVKDEFTESSDSYVQGGYDLLHEVMDFLTDALRRHHFGGIAVNTLPPESQHLRDRYLNGEVDDGAVKRTLELMEGVLIQRHTGRLPGLLD